MKIDLKINLFTLQTINRMWIAFEFQDGSYLDDLEKSICVKLQKDFINKQASRIGKKDKDFLVSLYKHEAAVLEKYLRAYSRHLWEKGTLERSKILQLTTIIQPQLL